MGPVRRAKAFVIVSLLCAAAAGTNLLSPAAAADSELRFDKDHDVLVLPDCHLALRYNNKTIAPVKAKLLSASEGYCLKDHPEKIVKIYEDFTSVGMPGVPEQVVLECYKSVGTGALNSNRFNNDFTDKNRVRAVQFTRARVASETGLLSSGFVGVTSQKSFEIVPKNGGAPYYLHSFQTAKSLTIFVRKMRDGKSFEDAPAVLTLQLRLDDVSNCFGNVEPAKPAAPEGTPASGSAPAPI